MPIDTMTLAGQILQALDTSSYLPEVMEKILDGAMRASNAETYVEQIISEVKVYPGADYDDDREHAVALLQEILKYEE